MAILYEYNITQDYLAGSYLGDNPFAQTFTPSIAHSITSVKFKTYRSGSIGTITAAIRATTGGAPSGGNLTTGTYNGDTLPAYPAVTEFEVELTSLALSAGVTYAIVMSYSGAGSWGMLTDHIGVTSYPDNYTGGSVWYSTDGGSTWTQYNGTNYGDMLFKEYGVGNLLPTEAITRVTSIIHRYDRGVYNMEIGLGDVISDFTIPVTDSIVRKAYEPKPEIPVPEIIREELAQAPPATPPAPAPTPAPPAPSYAAGQVAAGIEAGGQMVTCPHCGVRVASTQYQKHLNLSHPDKVVGAIPTVSEQVQAGLQAGIMITCPFCGVRVAGTQWENHLKYAHPDIHKRMS